MADTTKVALTVEQIATITSEIENFQKQSLQHAATSQTLSAHYHRLYMASKAFLKRADRLARTAKDREYTESRKNARSGSTTPAATPTSNPTPKQKVS